MKISESINALKKQQDDLVVELLSGGMTYQRVAEIVGCSMSKVQSVAKRHGLLRRAERPSATVVTQTTASVRAEKYDFLRGSIE